VAAIELVDVQEKKMGQLTDEIAALRSEREAAPPTNASEVGKRAIERLKAQGMGADVVKVGSQAPDFSLPDQNGQIVRLKDLLESGPVVVSFYRGSWCPFCNLELRGLQSSLPRIKELGANLVAISPQLPDGSLSLAERHALEFPVLSDVGNSVAKKFGIVFRLAEEHVAALRERGDDLARINGQDGAGELPIPTTFVINKRGIVQTAFVDADHSYRLDPDDMIAVLESIHAT
jgi:peroxiredoxin